MEHGFRLRQRLVPFALLLPLAAAACRQTPAVATLPPLGPGAPSVLGVPGARALAPRVAASSPFVAAAFATNDSRGAMVYLALSADNGATFSNPEPISTEATATPSSVHVSLDAESAARDGAPAVSVEWTLPDGRTSTRLLQPWRRRSVAQAALPQPPEPAAAACSSDGEVLLVTGHRGTAAVSVNHGLAEETCASRTPSAVIDARHWAHVAWIAGADDASARVLYAASSDREWFGGSQPMVDAGQRPAHLTLVTDPNDTVVATWDGEVSGRREVYLRQILPAHHGPATLLPLTRLSTEQGGVSPAIASITGGVLVAWLDERAGRIVVRRVGLDAICETTPAVTVTGSGAGVPAP